MAQVSRDASTPTLHQLQQPEKLRTVLGEDSPDDCLSCRLLGSQQSLTQTLSLSSSTDRVECPRCNGIYWFGSIQLLFRKAPVTPATGRNLEEQVQVWDSVTAGRYHYDRGGLCGDGSLAFDQLEYSHKQRSDLYIGRETVRQRWRRPIACDGARLSLLAGEATNFSKNYHGRHMAVSRWFSDMQWKIKVR